MIEFTDATIKESGGHYLDVCSIMNNDVFTGKWVLISDAQIAVDILVSHFKLYFYHDGRVIIYEANRPIEPNVPDSDLRELRDWCESFGWKRLELHDLLLENVRHYEYWLRLYQTGVIYNAKLEAKDADMMARLSSDDDDDDDDDDKNNDENHH